MDVRSWIRVGIVAGIVTIFLALVGLIGRFVDLNLVGEQVTFARLVLISAPLVAGYAVTRPRIRAGERRALAPRDAIVAGAVSGATAGLVFGIAVVAADAFGIDRIRSVFLNVSEPLIDFVTFGQPPVVGAVILTAVSAVAGGLAAGLRVTPIAVRRPITTAVSAVLVLGFGLNIVVGYAGLLDLGYVFFFAVGAYSTALLTGAALNTFTGSGPPALSLDLNFYLAIPIVLVIAAGAGLLIGAPVLRLRGDYLALVTLGLGEMVTVLVRSPWLVPLVGGPNGMRGVSDAAIAGFGFRETQHFYYLALGFVLLAVFVSWRLSASRIGRAWTAMREDEQTAEAMGVNTTRFKLL